MAKARPQRGKSSSVPVPSRMQIAPAELTGATASRVIDIIRLPLVILDDKLQVVFPNSTFCRVFGIKQNEIIGRHLTAIGDRRLNVAGFRDFLGLLQAGGTVVDDYEIEVEVPALGSRVLLLSGQQIYDEPTAPRGILVVIDDVTERRRAEMALIAAKWHSDRANLGKSRILAAASHDLRQPLQALNLMRAALAKKIKDEDGLRLVRQLDKTSNVMLGMLDALLEINQLEAGIVAPEEVEFPINDLLEQLKIEFTYHAQARGLRCHVVPCRMTVWSDPRLLEQMLRNLLSNAVKYTERGKILLGCRRRGDKLRIEVWDTAAAYRKGNSTRSSRSSINLTILPMIAHWASGSVSPSCSDWGVCWGILLMSGPVRERGQSSRSRRRLEKSSGKHQPKIIEEARRRRQTKRRWRRPRH